MLGTPHIRVILGFSAGFIISLLFRHHLDPYAPSISTHDALLGGSWGQQGDHYDLAETPAVFDTVPYGKHGKLQYIADNERVLNDLARCKANNNCVGHQDKVIIFVAYWCFAAVYEGYGGGEGVWCRSMLRSMRRLGYTSILIVRHAENWDYAHELYKAHSDDVLMIIGDRIDKAKNFYRSETRPDGIPAWKHMYFTYFPSAFDNVVGNEWSVCAEPSAHRRPQNFSFIGFDVQCKMSNYVPLEKRPPKALILGKRLMYFYGWNPAWDPTWFERATIDLRRTFHPDFEFLSTYKDKMTQDDIKLLGFKPEPPKGVRTLGALTPEEYDQLVAESRVLVGIGAPGSSPSPYGSLCEGTPFINPHKLNPSPNRNPLDPYDWDDVQHSTVRFLNPPYVYQVERHNYTSFLEGIEAALTTPTPPYQFEHLTVPAVDARMKEMLERDWYELAKVTLEKRLAGTEDRDQHGTIFEL